jgi:hypothetical protein
MNLSLFIFVKKIASEQGEMREFFAREIRHFALRHLYSTSTLPNCEGHNTFVSRDICRLNTGQRLVGLTGEVVQAAH